MDFSWILNHFGFPQGLIPQPPINRQDFQQSHDLYAGGRFERQNSEICRHNLGRRGQIFLLCSQVPGGSTKNSLCLQQRQCLPGREFGMKRWDLIGSVGLGGRLDKEGFRWRDGAGISWPFPSLQAGAFQVVPGCVFLLLLKGSR